jgi:hypothetical protein
MESNKCIIEIPTTINGKFFKYWVEFLSPIHHLTKLEENIFASILKQRYLLSEVIKDDDVLDSVVMSKDIREKIYKETGINQKHLNVVVGNLKRKKLIQNGKINRRFVPNIKEPDKGFSLIIKFTL